jgi:hypothetical protein
MSAPKPNLLSIPSPVLDEEVEFISPPPVKTEDEETVRTGVVAFLDALGTKGLGVNGDIGSILKARRNIRSTAQLHLEGPPPVFVGPYLPLGILLLVAHYLNMAQKGASVAGAKVVLFSDTYVLTAWGPDEPRKLLPWFSGVISQVVKHAAVEQGVFLRGAVSIGSFVQAPDGLFGPAVTDAAYWYEEADWIGVILTPSAKYGYDRNLVDSLPVDDLVNYLVPLHDEKTIETWAVAWPGRDPKTRTSLLDKFSANPVLPRDESKYRNTLQFVDYVSKTNPPPEAALLAWASQPANPSSEPAKTDAAGRVPDLPGSPG